MEVKQVLGHRGRKGWWFEGKEVEMVGGIDVLIYECMERCCYRDMYIESCYRDVFTSTIIDEYLCVYCVCIYDVCSGESKCKYVGMDDMILS